jgi:hypothetical protein
MKQTFRPVVDALESRWVPAVLLQLDANGNLTGIFGVPDGDITLDFTADDEVNVIEDAMDLGTYAVAGDLTVSLGNVVAATAVDVDMTGGESLSGSLRMTLGNALGGYDVTVTGDGATSSIFGNLTVRSGSGDDSCTVTDMAIGGSAYVDLGGGGDIMAFDTSTVGGNLATGNASALLLGTTVEGNFRHFMTENLGAGASIDVDSVVLGNATFNMAAGQPDIVIIEGTVEGNVYVNMRGGGDDLAFDVDATILGSFVYTGGSGTDTLDFDGTLGGNFTASLKGGDDTVDFDGAAILGSSIAIIAGNGADTLTNAGLTAPGARLTFLGGNGDDDVDWSVAIPVLASAYLDGGLGLNTFDDGGGPIDFPFTLRNFV